MTGSPRGKAGRFREPANPRAVPSGTTLRFLLLVLAMIIASVGMLQTTLETLAPSLSNGYIDWDCLYARGLDPHAPLGSNLHNFRRHNWNACMRANSYGPGLMGTAGMAVLALALYWVLPRWRSRRGGLVVIGEQWDPNGEIRAELSTCVQKARVTPPRFLVDAAATDASAVVFGRTKHHTVCLHAGLLAIRQSAPDRFRAVVLHELAHIRNRDVDIGYAVVALWRVFVIMVLVPSLLIQAAVVVNGVTHIWPALGGSDLLPSTLPINTRALIQTFFLLFLLTLARADTLRHRELQADADAIAAGADPNAWSIEAPAERSVVLRSLRELWYPHPSWRQRRRALQHSDALYSLAALQMFLIGCAAPVLTGTLRTYSSTNTYTWVAAAPAALIISLSVWRSLLHAQAEGRPEPTGIRSGLWLGLGLAAGELISQVYNFWVWMPEHPEFLLLLPLAPAAYAAWTAQCASLVVRCGISVRWTLWPSVAASCLLAGGGLIWWNSFGSLALTGNIWEAIGSKQAIQQLFPGSWSDYSTELDLFAPAFWYLVTLGGQPGPAGAALALWAIPLLLWLWPQTARRLSDSSSRSAGRETNAVSPAEFGVVHAVKAGLAGAAGCWLAVAGLMAWAHTSRPASGKRDLAFLFVYNGWLTAAIWAVTLILAASVAVTARRLPLVQAVIAGGLAQTLAVLGFFAASSADGCLGPFNVVYDSCSWRPRAALELAKWLSLTVLPALYGSAIAAAAVLVLAESVRRARPGCTRPGPDTLRDATPGFYSRRRRHLWRAGAAGLLSTAVVVPLWSTSLLHSGANDVSWSVPEQSAPANARDRARQAGAWWNDPSGGIHLYYVSSDYNEYTEKFDTFIRGNPKELWTLDAPKLRPVCRSLTRHARQAQRGLPFPDPALQKSWSAALKFTVRAGQNCLKVLDHPTLDDEPVLDLLTDGTNKTNKIYSRIMARVEEADRYWPGTL
ncbi:M48 family metalloprotease [Streptomyces sp. NPDC054866]